jgi:hypothetical protein
VLVELKKLEDARNAYGRAIQATPQLCGGALQPQLRALEPRRLRGRARATKRALEIDPYYVQQKFELAIDLEFEDPEFTIVPDWR